MMRSLALVLTAVVVASCGGSQSAGAGGPPGDDTAATPADTRTELERRLEAACDALEPRLVACAVDDSRAELAAGRITQQQFDDLTAPKWQDALRKKWATECNRRDRSSRQVRVLEVCFAEETECEPLLDCLEHLTRAQ